MHLIKLTEHLSPSASAIEDFGQDFFEVREASAWDDDAVAAAMSFLGDSQKSPAIVFSELNKKMFPFYLDFP